MHMGLTGASPLLFVFWSKMNIINYFLQYNKSALIRKPISIMFKITFMSYYIVITRKLTPCDYKI